MTKSSTRASIVDAAVAVAARRGISGSSMDEIAEQAGVAKGSLYYHFDSKDAIFTEVLRIGLERVVAAVDDARAGAAGDDARAGAAGDDARAGASPSPVLRAVVHATLATLRDNPDRAKIIASEMFRTDRSWHSAILPARNAVAVLFRDVLREAFPADAPRITEAAGAALFGAIAGAGLEWLLFHPDQPLDEVADQALVLFRG